MSKQSKEDRMAAMDAAVKNDAIAALKDAVDLLTSWIVSDPRAASHLERFVQNKLLETANEARRKCWSAGVFTHEHH